MARNNRVSSVVVAFRAQPVIHVTPDIQVEKSVQVVVEERRRRGPAVRTDARLGGHLLEPTVACVAVESIRSEVRDVDVVVTIVVHVTDGHAHAIAGVAEAGQHLAFSCSWGGRDLGEFSSVKPIVERELDVADGSPTTIEVTNLSPLMIYPRLILSGLPEPGSEQPAANGMRLDVTYMAMNGEPIDPSDLEQGTDVRVQITVENIGDRGDYDEVALSHIVPSSSAQMPQTLPSARPSLVV